MNALEVFRIVLMGVLGLVVVAMIFAPLPIGGMGLVPIVGVSWIYLPLVIPVIVLLLAAVSVATADEIRIARAGAESTPAHDSLLRSESGNLPPEYDRRDPIEILQEQYTDDEITHAEYEQRLEILLDADDSDELKSRLDRLSDDPNGSGKL